MDTMRGPGVRVVMAALAALLLALAPAAAQAGKPTPFEATGVLLPGDTGWFLTPGDVTPAGQSGRFVVKDRLLTGVFAGDIAGPFSFTFGTNVPITTQSGQFHGTLVAGAYEAQARGASSFVQGPVLAYVPGVALPGLPPNLVPAVKLALSGTLTLTDGAQGNGVVNGTLTVAVEPATGHILFLVPSYLPLFNISDGSPAGLADTHVSIDGQWHQ